MTVQVTTMFPVTKLSELNLEWRVIAFRPNGDGEWRWYLDPIETRAVKSMISDRTIISAHRRDRDGTRLLAKVRNKNR